jgi:hypothetical protein
MSNIETRRAQLIAQANALLAKARAKLEVK